MVIEPAAFADCYSLTSLDLPEGVQAIGEGCFFNCTRLRHLRIPSSVVKIGPRAFMGCSRLTSVHLLGNLHTIAEGTFYMCPSLTHVRIPSSVGRIACAAFSCCTRLISLELPEGLEMIDLDGEYNLSRSLLNLVIPPEQDFQQPFDVDLFMNGLKLRHVASNVDDLVSKLKHQFDTLPVHRLCYYQSYYPLTEAMENLRQSMDVDPSAGTKVDSYGMTPFHILALSQTPKLFLFQALLKVNKVDIILRTTDKLGSTPMDYLCLNRTSDSGMVIQALIPAIIAQRLQWLGLARWKSVISTAMNKALAAVEDIESSNQRAIALLCFKLSAYERLEVFRYWSWHCGKPKLTGARLHSILIMNGTKNVAPRGLYS
jgi:hypothetical protein